MKLTLPPETITVMRVIKMFGQKHISAWHIKKPKTNYFYCGDYNHLERCEYETSTLRELPENSKMCSGCWKF